MSEIFYFVSAEPDRITRPDFNRDHMTNDQLDHPHYQTAADAVDAIRAEAHGATGHLYVIKAELTVEATATRGWELRKGERP